MRDETEHEVVPLARFARRHGLELRFIEYMPLDAGHRWEREKVLFAADIIALLTEGVGPLVVSADQDPRAPALDYQYADGGGKVGFIAMAAGGADSRTIFAAGGIMRPVPLWSRSDT